MYQLTWVSHDHIRAGTCAEKFRAKQKSSFVWIQVTGKPKIIVFVPCTPEGIRLVEVSVLALKVA